MDTEGAGVVEEAPTPPTRTEPWRRVQHWWSGSATPGPEYAETRHNVGVRVVDLLAARAGGGRFSKHKANADVLEGRLAGRRVVLAVPGRT